MGHTLAFNPEAVSAVLLPDGWHRSNGFRVVNLTGGWQEAFSFEAPDEPVQARTITGPWSAIVAIRTKYMETAEDREERAEQAEQDRLALFNWQHRCSPAVYDAAAERQNDLCPGCGSLLDSMPITHWVADKNAVLCGNCSGIQHRYGTP